MAALPASELPTFLRKIEEYDGEPQTKLAMRLLALTFVRTNELRGGGLGGNRSRQGRMDHPGRAHED